MDPQDPLFQHLPLPGLVWSGSWGPAARPNRAFERSFCLRTLPDLGRWPDGTHVLRLGLRGGERHVCRVHLDTLPDRTRLGVIEDVQAYHQDALTGLEDRRALLLDAEGLGAASLALLDIDGFKEVNDALGHAAGDEVLRALAGLLASAAHTWGARAYRLGGDEFVLLGETPLTAGHLGVVRARFARRLAALGLGARGFSWGLAHAPGDGRHLTELLLCADARLLARKAGRRGGLAAQLVRLQGAPPRPPSAHPWPRGAEEA